MQAIITGVGAWTPNNVVTNEELVESYNAWAVRFNAENAEAILSLIHI